MNMLEMFWVKNECELEMQRFEMIVNQYIQNINCKGEFFKMIINILLK